MHLKLDKASGKSKCRYPKCRKLEQYITSQGRIVSGSTCLAITTASSSGYHTSYYCRDCCETLYLELKAMLNPEYWAFH